MAANGTGVTVSLTLSDSFSDALASFSTVIDTSSFFREKNPRFLGVTDWEGGVAGVAFSFKEPSAWVCSEGAGDLGAMMDE